MGDNLDEIQQAASEAMELGDMDQGVMLQKMYREALDEKIKAQLYKPGKVCWTDDATDSPLKWRTEYGPTVNTTGNIPDEDYKAAQELDQRRQIKIFVHFSKLFVERFSNWEIRPDAADPFNRVVVAHKSKDYKIISGYPSNEVQIHGVPNDKNDKAQKFYRRHGIPPSSFGRAYDTVPFQNYYAWALGVEDDLPEWVKHE